MSGIRIWDKATNVEVITTSTAIQMPLGVFAFGGDGSAASGSITDARLGRGTPKCQLLQVGIGPNTTYKFVGQAPSWYFSGTTFYWSFPGQAGTNPPYCRVLLSII